MKSKLTDRGFKYNEFRDGYGAKCKLQESSAARFEDEDGTVSDGFIWLGMTEDRDGNKAHTHIDKVSEQKIPSHMHLSQSNVKDLLPSLIYFAKHGELPQLTIDDIEEVNIIKKYLGERD